MLNVSKRQEIGRIKVPDSSPNRDSLLHAQCFKNTRYKKERGLESSLNWDN